MIKNGCNTHIVLKVDDCLKYLTETEIQTLESIQNKISRFRCEEGKNPDNHYYICNIDEPYAEMIKGVIYGGEYEKELYEHQNLSD